MGQSCTGAPSTTNTSGKSSAQQLLHSVTLSVIRTARSTGSMQQVAAAIYFFLVAAFFLGAVFFLATAFFGAVFFLALGLAAALGLVTFLAALALGLVAALGLVTFLAALALGLVAALGLVTFLAALALAATGFCAARRRSAQPWVLVGRRHAERGAPAKAASTRTRSHTQRRCKQPPGAAAAAAVQMHPAADELLRVSASAALTFLAIAFFGTAFFAVGFFAALAAGFLATMIVFGRYSAVRVCGAAQQGRRGHN